MIPLIYRLRGEIRFEEAQDACTVISPKPLNLVRVNPRGAHMLRLCDGTRSVSDIAALTGAGEEQVLKFCRYFNRTAFLEIVGCVQGAHFPSVSVVIPTKDHRDELYECLESVFSQEYPSGEMEVIVVDDGSQEDVGPIAQRFPCKLISNVASRGPAFSRNRGAKEASKEILAFLDSDCVAGRTWLKELVGYFQWDSVGAVGGYVDGYYHRTALDRYEKAFSPLNMGKHILMGADDGSTFYVPTCNLLVRRSMFTALGFREDMHVGEDVDFCWRMRQEGHLLLYAPSGSVKHKHRNELLRMLERRTQYGSSEAILYARHPDKKKTFPAAPLAAASFGAICLAIVLLSAVPLALAAVLFAVESGMKLLRTFRSKARFRDVLSSVFRTHAAFFYFASFHLVRYYTVLLLILGWLFPQIWLWAFSMLILAAVVDFRIKRPQLAFPAFLLYYVLDHISYQAGVFVGCVRQRTFGSYAPQFVKRPLIPLSEP